MRMSLLHVAAVIVTVVVAPVASRSQDLRTEIEEVVRDYLASHPDEVGAIAKDYMVKHPEAMAAGANAEIAIGRPRQRHRRLACGV
jgi:hypothetical protein